MGKTSRALVNHFRKWELQWLADHSEAGGTLPWLAPHCNSVEEIAEYLRELGFGIKSVVDIGKTSWGGNYHWVTTTSRVVVYMNDEYTQGFTVKRKSL